MRPIIASQSRTVKRTVSSLDLIYREFAAAMMRVRKRGDGGGTKTHIAYGGLVPVIIVEQPDRTPAFQLFSLV